LSTQASTAARAAGVGEYDGPRAAELIDVKTRYSADKRFRDFSDLITKDPTDPGAVKFEALLAANPELALTPKVLFDDRTIGEPLKLVSPLAILVRSRNFKYIEIMLDAVKDDRALESLVNKVDEFTNETPLWTAVHDAITFKEGQRAEKESHEAFLVAKVLLLFLASPSIDSRYKDPDERTPLQLIRRYSERYEANNRQGAFERLDGGKWKGLEDAMHELFKRVHLAHPILPNTTKKFLQDLR